MFIFHAVPLKKWEFEASSEKYGEDIVMLSGSIKCVVATRANADNFSFPSTNNYIILCIDTNKVTSDIAYDGDFAFINGALNKSAIVANFNYTFDNEDKFVKDNNVNDIIIIDELLSKLNESYVSHKYFNNGTSSRIFLLNDKYTVKQASPRLLQSEFLFSDAYKDVEKLQKMVYHDPGFKYVVYSYVPGDVMHVVDDADDLFANIKDITNSYKTYSGEEFGFIYEPETSWKDFLKTRVHDCSLRLPEADTYLSKVYEAIEALNKFDFDKKLIHGDFGTHNFIKLNGKFEKAIDPAPIAGDKLYDVIFACISNVGLLNKLSVDFLAEYFDEPKEKVSAMLTILLFCRMSACLAYHKEDFDSYVDLWYKLHE